MGEEEETGRGNWQHGMFGCFDNCGICIWTFLCPCIAFGKTAGALGDSCCLHTCFFFIPIFNLYLAINMRRRIRKELNIPGGCLRDVLWKVVCGPCTFVQERQECVESLGGEEMARN